LSRGTIAGSVPVAAKVMAGTRARNVIGEDVGIVVLGDGLRARTLEERATIEEETKRLAQQAPNLFLFSQSWKGSIGPWAAIGLVVEPDTIKPLDLLSTEVAVEKAA